MILPVALERAPISRAAQTTRDSSSKEPIDSARVGRHVVTRPEPVPPGPGQESVWDYPRPPGLEPTPKRIEVWLGGEKIVDTTRSWRVLETSHPSVYYVPADDVTAGALHPGRGGTMCEWKGQAQYFDIRGGNQTAKNAAWSYPRPTAAYAPIAGYFAFYPGKMDECRVAGARVVPQPGSFYGGWITPEVVGPFKGEPNSGDW
jgi:uncharacterized protein (DUF427 family)